MKRYPEYKESGVEWIGEMPRHWEVLKAKHVGSSNPPKNNLKTARLKDKLVVFLPMERVHTDGTIDQELRLPYSQLKNGYTYFEEGDILIAKVTPCFENGKIVHINDLATSVGFGSTEFIVIRPDLQRIFPPFLYYIFRSDPLRSIGKHFMTSAIGLKRVPTEFVENFQIPIPVYQEQTQIANFLDRKTEQIDKLIRIKERRIELLQEQRTALINQAVTKGLDPNVKMKPSGVEWIGEIPAHWESKRLGHVSTIFKGGTPKRNVDRYFQGDLPWARPVDITALQGALHIHDTGIHISEEALKNSAARRLPPGTVLLTSRATIGEIAITTVPMATNQGFANFICHEQLLNIYLAYYLRAIKDLLISLGSGSTYLEVTKGTLVGVAIPLPPLSEQTQIANFLNRKTKQIDELITTEQRKIELLKEYRQSLISEAVTGKIDVRNKV